MPPPSPLPCWYHATPKKGKQQKKKPSPTLGHLRHQTSPSSLFSLSSLSPSLSFFVLTLLAKSYLKPEYLSLGFFQSETFSSTAATTCELVRRVVEVFFDVVIGFGSGEDNLAAVAAERLVVALLEAVEVVDTDLRDDDILVRRRLIAKLKAEEQTTRRGERDDAPTKNCERDSFSSSLSLARARVPFVCTSPRPPPPSAHHALASPEQTPFISFAQLRK